MVQENQVLKLNRTLLFCAGGAYLNWWLFVHLTLPAAFNPFLGRAGVVACFFAALAASYASPWVARNLGGALALCCGLATAHYFYLFDRNQADLNWMIGSYITVIAVCAVLQNERHLLIYSVFVAALSVAVSMRAPHLPLVVFLPGMLTILGFAYIGLRSRLRLLDQVQKSHLQDIHELVERKRIEDALVQSNQELESFSYSVAHDLRAPLRGIHGFSRILLEDHAPNLDPEARQYLQRIGAGAEAMGQLIDALLSLARLSRTAIQREPVDLARLADPVIKQLQASEPKRAVEFVNAPTHPARGDPTLLRAVLENLLGNAWKFTSARPSARITLGSTEMESGPVYFVQDNGAGFNMAYSDKLFAPFQRLHKTSEFAGTGIGLATVQRIISRHGGRVWAKGEVDGGATFYFTLPEGPESPPP